MVVSGEDTNGPSACPSTPTIWGKHHFWPSLITRLEIWRPEAGKIWPANLVNPVGHSL